MRQVAPQQRVRAECKETHAAQGEGDQRDDDDRVEDDGAQDRRTRAGQVHDVQRRDGRERHEQHRRDDGEVFRHVVGDGKRRQRTARHEQLFADLDDLDQLCRVAVEIDHVARFLGGLRAGVHGDAHVGLRERGSVVGAVAGHGDEPAAVLLAADVGELVLGRGLGEEIVHARLPGDGLGGERIVTGDHDRLDPHRAEPLEAIRQPTLDNVLEVDDAQRLLARGDDQRRAALAGNLLHRCFDLGWEFPADERAHAVGRALAVLLAVEVDAAHARLRGEGHELGVGQLREFAPPDALLLFGEDNNRAAFGASRRRDWKAARRRRVRAA